MKDLFFFIIFCLSANIVSAQTYDYEFTAIVPLDAMDIPYEKTNDTLIGLHTVRYTASDTIAYQANPLYEALIRLKNLKWFEDKNFEKPIKQSIFKAKIDSIDRSDTNTCIVSTAFIVTDFNPEDIIDYALLHKIKYDSINHKVTCNIAGIAPVTKFKIGNREGIESMWLKLPLEYKKDETAPDFAFAKLVTLSIKNETMCALNTDKPLANRIYDDTQSGKWQPYQTDNGYGKWQPYKASHYNPTSSDLNLKTPYPPKDFEWVGKGGVDTVVNYDPITYAEIITVVKTAPAKASDFSRSRFKMLYTFDEKTFQLACKVERIGVEQNINDMGGKFQRCIPIFYIKPEN
jgi:Gliding motility associated protein GldN